MRVEAALLAASRETMRVTMEAQRDAIELHKVDSGWYTDTGEEIEIEALLPLADTDVSQFCREVYPRTSTAGHGSMFI
ncbi:MAG TPA: hypothetical protein VNV86_19090 [Candidatus Acidoferrum sp.]|nr:hypothetical protein [Candidatus Acidoferrum sp.]